MGKIAVELVPREEKQFRAELQTVKEKLPTVKAINIPDLLSCEMSGPAGAAISKEYFDTSIAHIRAMDIDLNKPLPMAEMIKKSGIKEVLVIEGDPPTSMTHVVYPTETVDVIWKFKKELPGVKVYAGIDQYRGSMRSEEYRIRRKLNAGADGFFTQPFFDMRYLEIYADMLAGLDVYWGITPVLSANSRSYWERKNNVVFPKDFAITPEWNENFGRKVYEFAVKHDANVYIMPIKADFVAYVSGIIN